MLIVKKSNKQKLPSKLDKNAEVYLEDLDIIKQLRVSLSSGFAEYSVASEETIQYAKLVNKIKVQFTRITKMARQKCLSHLISVITNPHTQQDDFVTACVLLSILELSYLRNSDHLDTDAADFENDSQKLFSKLFSLPYISDFEQLTDLMKWAYDILVISFRHVFFWFVNIGFNCIETFVNLDFHFAPSSLSNFRILKSIFKHQSCAKKIQPQCFLRNKFDFLDILLLSLKVSDFDDIESVIISPKRLKLTSDVSILELSDYSPKIDAELKVKSVLSSDDKDGENFESLIELKSMLDSTDPNIQIGSVSKILQLKNQSILKSNKEQSILIIASTLKKSHSIISLCLSEKKEQYESVFCNLLRLWVFMTEGKHLLTYLPQSYLYLTPFIAPNYKLMTLNGFIECVSLQGSFLVKYMDCFRSNVVTSPHWYIDMLVSMVVEIISRCTSGLEFNSLLTDSICLAIADIGRASQMIFNTDLKSKISRCAKVPLEFYVCAVAASSTPLPILIKKTLIEACVNNWLESIDKFTLEQCLLSLKPGPKEVLKRLISNFNQYKQ